MSNSSHVADPRDVFSINMQWPLLSLGLQECIKLFVMAVLKGSPGSSHKSERKDWGEKGEAEFDWK